MTAGRYQRSDTGWCYPACARLAATRIPGSGVVAAAVVHLGEESLDLRGYVLPGRERALAGLARHALLRDERVVLLLEGAYGLDVLGIRRDLRVGLVVGAIRRLAQGVEGQDETSGRSDGL